MGIREDTQRVKSNIVDAFEAKKIKLYALSLSYAGQAINLFRSRQASGEYWENRTNQAKDRMFSDAFIESDTVGWFLSHGVEYGVYLELANDRQNEAIRPIIQELSPKFFADARKII